MATGHFRAAIVPRRCAGRPELLTTAILLLARRPTQSSYWGGVCFNSDCLYAARQRQHRATFIRPDSRSDDDVDELLGRPAGCLKTKNVIQILEHHATDTTDRLAASDHHPTTTTTNVC